MHIQCLKKEQKEFFAAEELGAGGEVKKKVSKHLASNVNLSKVSQPVKHSHYSHSLNWL